MLKPNHNKILDLLNWLDQYFSIKMKLLTLKTIFKLLLTWNNGYTDRKRYFDYDFSKEFLLYLYDKQLDEITQLLVNNMDEESQSIVSITLKSHRYLIENNIIERRNFSINSEKDEIAKIKRCIFNARRCIPLALDHYNPEAFYYHHGLKTDIPQYGVGLIKNRDFIDAGAFIGDSAVILSNYDPRKIYSFEPDRETFALLEKTIELNDLNSIIIPVSKGLGFDDINNNLISIDSFVALNQLDVGLIKLDVEGQEFNVISSAKKTIMSHRPVLLISIYHTGKDFFEIKPLLEDWLQDYSFSIRRYNPLTLVSDILLLAWPNQVV